MALQQTYTLSSGASGNYWTLDSFQVNVADSTLTCIVSLYLDSTSPGNGLSPVYQTSFCMPVDLTLPVQDANGAPEDLTAWAYQVLMTTCPTFTTPQSTLVS